MGISQGVSGKKFHGKNILIGFLILGSFLLHHKEVYEFFSNMGNFFITSQFLFVSVIEIKLSVRKHNVVFSYYRFQNLKPSEWQNEVPLHDSSLSILLSED